MNRFDASLAATLILAPILSLPNSVRSAGDLSAGEPVRITIQTSTDDNGPRFKPDQLSLETGKLYALRIENPGPGDYYFGSQGLADAVFTRKVVVTDKAGRDMVQVYGPVRRFEIKAGNAVEWWFVPVRTGKFDDLRSTRTHTEAGMRGTIEVR